MNQRFLLCLLLCAGCGSEPEMSPDLAAPTDGGADLSVTPSPDLLNPLCRQANLPLPPEDGGLGQYMVVAYPPENTFTPEKAMLGKILFWDEQLSSDNTVACGTCHHPSAGGADPRAGHAGSLNPGPDGVLGTADDPHGGQGIARCDDSSGTVVRVSDPHFGLNPQVTRRLPRSYLDAMFPTELFWDGRAHTQFIDPTAPDGGAVIVAGGALESQAVGPPINDGEMACENRTWQKIGTKLASATPLALAHAVPNEMAAAICAHPTYPELFQAAYGTPDITAVRIAFAIATHERTLISDQTPWDAYTQNNTALTASQEAGRQVFFGQGLCSRCHPSPLFGGDQFVNLGFSPDTTFDKGREEPSGQATDQGKFRAVGLRNVGLREANGLTHNGIGKGVDLPTLIGAYNTPPQLSTNTDPRMLSTLPLNLTAQQQSDLVEFLRTALTDPRVANETFPFDRPKLSTEN